MLAILAIPAILAILPFRCKFVLFPITCDPGDPLQVADFACYMRAGSDAVLISEVTLGQWHIAFCWSRHGLQ
jgi:hypothetical protein